MWETMLEQVNNAFDQGSAPAPEVQVETVPSQEVKIEETPVVETPEVETPVVPETVVKVSEDKYSEQIKNLNTALKEEREARKAMEDKLSQAASNTDVVEKLKNVFAPPVEEQPEPETPKFLTAEEVEEYLNKREEERLNEKKLAESKEALITEIKELESKWNWENWSPKYDDNEVLEWQKNNGKLALSPSDAFLQMKREEILDYEIKKRMEGKPQPTTSEKPSGISTEHQPEPKKVSSDAELKAAIYEALESWNAEI